MTKDFSGASLCRRLADEGNLVRALVQDRSCISFLDGVVEKVEFEAEKLSIQLKWLGKEGLIVADDSGFGQIQDDLRSQGYAVVGNCAGADRLEEDRPYCQEVLKQCGIQTLPIHHFATVPEAINFLEEKRGRWVLKHNGYTDKAICYVGQLDSSEDLLDILRNFVRTGHGISHVVLQQYVSGIEIGVARYFNGTDWIGPVEMNIEHKKLFPSDLGPKTAEMGTLMWYDGQPDTNQLFNTLLAPLKPHLKAIGFHGDFDINCIVNSEGAWPLEVTARFGYPAAQCQMELHQSRWTDFLLAVARGEDADLKWCRGYAVAVLIASPPFPYQNAFHRCTEPSCGDGNSPITVMPWLSPSGLRLHFHEAPNSSEFSHYHLEEVLRHAIDDWEICGESGYILHVTGHGESVDEAQVAAYRRAANVVIPRSFYRNDIGDRFIKESQHKLRQWGYMK